MKIILWSCKSNVKLIVFITKDDMTTYKIWGSKAKWTADYFQIRSIILRYYHRLYENKLYTLSSNKGIVNTVKKRVTITA